MAVHYMNGPLQYAIEENFEGSLDDHDDVSLAEVLQDQEIVYESLQRNGQVNNRRTTSNANSQYSSFQDQSLREKNTTRSLHLNSQLANDEAIAKELQDLEYQLVGISFDATNSLHSGRSPTIAATPNPRSTQPHIPAQVPTDDGIDSDNMTYEELQQLGEAIGTESRGLSNVLIERLPKSTYKSGRIFSRKEKHEECVICCTKYESKEKLITLPCNHKYHMTCVTKWLKINKTCPVCSKEVFGS